MKKPVFEDAQQYLFPVLWEMTLERSVEQHKAVIKAMAEHARRCIGQQHRRNQEHLCAAMVRAVGGINIAKMAHRK